LIRRLWLRRRATVLLKDSRRGERAARANAQKRMLVPPEALLGLRGRYLGCIVGVMTDPVSAKPTGAITRTYIDANPMQKFKAWPIWQPRR
jgi:hypothetical protein